MTSQVYEKAEFPRDMVAFLRCSRDGENFSISDEVSGTAFGIVSAKLKCTKCGSEHAIVDGIARFVGSDLSPEDIHESDMRDAEYAEASEYSPCSRSELSDFVELPPFLRALDIGQSNLVMEIGCGDGRFTLLMCQRGAQILAIDISLNALKKLNGRLATGRAPTPFPQDEARMKDFRPRVALIHSDASKIRLAPECLDRALSTTPLDSKEQRMSLYNSISESLKDDGWFIGSTEYDDLFRRNLGLPTATRYEEGGIFIEHFDVKKIRRETAPYFGTLKTWPIRPRVPLIHRLSPKIGTRISNLISKMPVLRDMGEILLFRAAAPVRSEAEGVHRPGNAVIKRLFGLYSRSFGKEPLWRWEKVRF
jgi:SAM-dependent methyltransferase